MIKRNRILVAILLCILWVGGIVIVQLERIKAAVRNGDYSMKPFERISKDAPIKILILGDSTGVGTGSNTLRESIAALLANEYPTAEIKNNSYNGRKVGDLRRELNLPISEHFDLTVMMIGGNDVMHFSNLRQVADDIHVLLSAVRSFSSHVVLLHSGDIGQARIFIWPISLIMSVRTRMLRQIYLKEIAQIPGGIYINLMERLKNNPIVFTDAYYGPDGLHPSALGYRMWYQEIKRALVDAHVDLNSQAVIGLPHDG